MRSAQRALLVAALALVSALALAPAQALAHGGNPNFRSEIDSIQPPLPSGVSIEVLDYDSYLQLLDQHGHEVVIYGYEDEPYARILQRRHRAGEPALAGHLPERQPLRRRRRCRRSPTRRRRRSGRRSTTPGPSSGTTTGCTTCRPRPRRRSRTRASKTKIFDYEDPAARSTARRAPSTAPSSGSAARTPRRPRSSIAGDRDRPRRRRAGAAASAAAPRRRRRPMSRRDEPAKEAW